MKYLALCLLSLLNLGAQASPLNDFAQNLAENRRQVEEINAQIKTIQQQMDPLLQRRQKLLDARKMDFPLATYLFSEALKTANQDCAISLQGTILRTGGQGAVDKDSKLFVTDLSSLDLPSLKTYFGPDDQSGGILVTTSGMVVEPTCANPAKNACLHSFSMNLLLDAKGDLVRADASIQLPWYMDPHGRGDQSNAHCTR